MAVGELRVRSSSSMRSSLRSISSRRRRIRERLLAEVIGKGPSRCWPGQVSRAGLTSRYSALPLCITGRAKHLLIAWPTAEDLFIYAKDLFIAAMDADRRVAPPQ